MGRSTAIVFDLQPDPFDPATPNRKLCLGLFKGVKNSVQLRLLIRDEKIDAALIRAELIVEPFILLAAANRAVHFSGHMRLSTRSEHAEILYSLSPSKNVHFATFNVISSFSTKISDFDSFPHFFLIFWIAYSLEMFGIDEKSQNILVAVLDDPKGKKLADIGQQIDGQPANLNELRHISDHKLIKEVYHVKEPELNKATITDAIISRIVAKDFVA